MAQVMCTINHFTHNHPLTKYTDGRDYFCGGCKLPGDGRTARYGCATCNFNLHEYCATGPRSLLTFMHPSHELTLNVREPESTRLQERSCNLCGDIIEGLFYACKTCDFDIHPVCSQLPERVTHTLHRGHPLRLQRIADTSSCLVCMELCSSWHYRCEYNCHVGIHIGCILSAEPGASESNASTSRSVVGQRPGAWWHQSPAKTPYHPPYGGGYAYNLLFPGVFPPPPYGGYNFPAASGEPNPLLQHGGYFPPQHHGGYNYNYFQAAAGGLNPQAQAHGGYNDEMTQQHYDVSPHGYMIQNQEVGRVRIRNKIGRYMSKIVSGLILRMHRTHW